MIGFYLTLAIINLISTLSGLLTKNKGWWVGLIGVALFGYLLFTEVWNG